jgi:hypothetical protein
MLEPRRLTTLWASTACYRDSFTFYLYLTCIFISSAHLRWSVRRTFRQVGPNHNRKFTAALCRRYAIVHNSAPCYYCWISGCHTSDKIICDTTPHSPVNVNQSFGGTLPPSSRSKTRSNQHESNSKHR